MFDSIQSMINRSRATYGDSKISYGSDDISKRKKIPQGVLEGYFSAPAIWTVPSSIVFEILHKQGFAVPIRSAISQNIFLLVELSYVDDCDLIQSGFNPEEVLISMHSLINIWGSLIKVTRGALSIDTSWWYLV